MGYLITLYYKIKNRPFGNACVAACSGTFLILCSLSLGVAHGRFYPLALSMGVGLVAGLATALLLILQAQRAKLNDVHFSISLENGLRRAGYKLGDFFTDGAAGNPSLQLLHLKILRLCRPGLTLELGSGQTTKILSCYKRENPSAFVLTLEQDESWHRCLQAGVDHDYRHALLERREFTCAGTGRRLSTEWYQLDPRFLVGQKFNYVLVDGPDHGQVGMQHIPYSRCGILEYMPDCLATSFIVVFDDIERAGEARTADALDAILRAKGVRFFRFACHGIKTQDVFCSPDLGFMRSV